MRTEIAQRPPEAEAPERTSRLPALVLDTLEMGAVALDRERRVVYANRRIEELLGVEPGALLSLPGNRVFPGADARWLKGASRESRDFRIEAGDRDLTLRGESVPMRDEEGELAGSVVIAEAISESEDGEFQKKIDRLVSLGELSAYVAHEIRNPLTGIRTTVQFVASKLRAGDSRRDDLQDVLKELDRIEQIITDLLLFARPQAARPVPTDLREIVEKVLDNLARRFMDGGIEVDVDLDADIPLVQIDPDMVQQVVLNLAINAIQAMPGGGVLRVTTGLRRTRYKKAYVDVTVADTGPGIPDEVKEKIFDPFFTTRSMGTGLGLSISLQIAREHGGNLTARNLAQGGAAFRFALPALLTPDDAATAEPKNGDERRPEAKAVEGKAADAKATEAKTAEPRERAEAKTPEPRERAEAKTAEPRERAEAREKVEEKA